MKRTAILVVLMMTAMALPASMANIAAPNDTSSINDERVTLSIDGYVNTKFASVGSEVEIKALTRGHSDDTIVTADILLFPTMDPITLMTTVSLPEPGVAIDKIVLANSGPHEDDPNTMTWAGSYMVPVDAVGGVYGASIIAEDGNLRASDDPTQLGELFRLEVEKVLNEVANAWELSNPMADIADEFADLNQRADNNGGWAEFETAARDGEGPGGSQQFWDAMIDAGHNQYNLSAGSNFLEAWMDIADSPDQDAAATMTAAMLLYAEEFPMPRTMNDFSAVAEYLLLFDPIENFTRFQGTGDFEAAYNALIGSDEYNNLRDALEDLANNHKQFEAIQTILHNFALLAVSGHPEAIVDALEAFIQPVLDGDYDSMTPFQKFIVRFAEMGEPESVDYDDDGIPDELTWQYEILLETSEGQAWTAKMEADSSWVNDVVDEFNTLPEDILEHVIDSVMDPAWKDVIEAGMEFGEWIRDASGEDRWMYGPEWDEESGEMTNTFDRLEVIKTRIHDPHVLDLGIELSYWASDGDHDYPLSYQMSMSNTHGEQIVSTLTQDDNDQNRYFGRLTATNIDATTWTFSQPLEDVDEEIDNMELTMEFLRPSMLETMVPEGIDEMFVISSVGVLVDQDLTTDVDAPYTINTLSYDGVGPVANAAVDIAVIRASPQAAETAIENLNPQGDVEITVASDDFSGRYTAGDLAGDLNATISHFDSDDDKSHPQAADIGADVEIQGMGTFWDATGYLAGTTGLVTITSLGKTTNGVEFQHMTEAPLPGTGGCGQSSGHGGDSNTASISWNWNEFDVSGGDSFNKEDLASLWINWGDGTNEEYSDGGNQDSGWESHDYGMNQSEYDIKITYEDVNGYSVDHDMTFTPYQGYYNDEWDGHDHYTTQGWCWLESSMDSIPSAALIDSFISDGPIEVMDEQIVSSDADGAASLEITPTLPGVYLTIVQSKATNSDGDVMTGVGMNLASVMNSTVEVGGITEVSTLAGVPVSSFSPDGGGLHTFTITPTGVTSDEYMAIIALAPLDLSVPFPDIESDIWGEPDTYELQFEQGDTTRSQEVRLKAPVTMMSVLVMEGDSEVNYPSAMYSTILVADPGNLSMEGTLGPGQTTNIALADEHDPATRILGMAAPSVGFDPASIDLSSFTEFIWEEGARNEFGWIDAERNIGETCVEVNAWLDEWDSSGNAQVEVNVYESRFTEDSGFNHNYITLRDGAGQEVSPAEGFSQSDWDDNRYEATFQLDEDSDETYTLTVGIEVGDFEFSIVEDEEMGDKYIEFERDSHRCTGDEILDEAEEFAMFDSLFSNLNSVAWGVGSSADLRLPILSSPQDEYTVIAVAQQGSGETATVMSALGTQVSQPNPEPPVLKNLTMIFGPADPKAGDDVIVTITDEDHQPVSGLSVMLLRNNQTLFGTLSDGDGQVEFVILSGTIMVKASGGMYNPAELVIIVDEQGTMTESGEELPADDDGDNVINSEDMFPNDPTESEDTDGDGVGDNEDAFPADPDESADEDGDGIGDNAQSDGFAASIFEEPMVLTGIIAGVVLIIVTLLLTLRLRGGRDDSVWVDATEEKWNAPAIMDTAPVAAGVHGGGAMFDAGPSTPSPSMQGEMRDGYEVLEHPANSGKWWYKDGDTGQWDEWL